MPHEYLLDRARRRLTLRARDPVNLAEVLALLDRQAADGAWTYAVLRDARGVTWTPSTQDVRHALAQVWTLSLTHGPRGPVAVVATDPGLFGMARMYASLGEEQHLTVRVFYDLIKAKRWLAEQAVLMPHERPAIDARPL